MDPDIWFEELKSGYNPKGCLRKYLKDNTDHYLGMVEIKAYIVQALIDELDLMEAKMKLLVEYIEAEDGIFGFPDGDYIETGKKS
jgi:hypothetical protein